MKGRISLLSVAVFIVCTIFLSFLTNTPSFATDYYWIGGSGDWSDPSNWNPGVPSGSYADPASIYLTQSDSTNRTVTLSTNSTSIRRLDVDGTGTGTMILSTSGGLSSTGPGDEINFRVGIYGTGIVNQTGGVQGDYLTLGVNPGSVGTYNLNGGSIGGIATTLLIGGQGTGTFNQSGGNVSTDYDLTVGPLGTYNLSGTGSISPYAVAVAEGISGTFNQSGGVNNLGGLGGLGISGGTYNLSGGEVKSSAFPGGSNNGTAMTNNGTFNQSDGAFGMAHLQIGATTADTSRFNLSGGILQAYEIMNNGTFTYSGGELHILPFDVSPYPYMTWTNALTNNGTCALTGAGTRTVDGNVVNNGTFKVTQTTAVYTGTFTNNGAYISDPAKNYFTNLTIGTTGYLTGGTGDEFHISGDFLNHSQNPLWNTGMADLFFGPGAHTFFLGDTGSSFTWDDMTLDLGTTLDLEGGAGFHVDTLHVFDLAQLTGSGHILYDRLVIESVPEPSTLLLVSFALIGLVGFRRKFKGVNV